MTFWLRIDTSSASTTSRAAPPCARVPFIAGLVCHLCGDRPAVIILYQFVNLVQLARGSSFGLQAGRQDCSVSWGERLGCAWEGETQLRL